MAAIAITSNHGFIKEIPFDLDSNLDDPQVVASLIDSLKGIQKELKETDINQDLWDSNDPAYPFLQEPIDPLEDE